MLFDTNSTILQVTEEIAEIYGETKYTLSFFANNQKLKQSANIASLNIGFTARTKVPDH